MKLTGDIPQSLLNRIVLVQDTYTYIVHHDFYMSIICIKTIEDEFCEATEKMDDQIALILSSIGIIYR